MKHKHMHERIDNLISNNDFIVKAIQDGARAALKRHRQAGVPVVVSKSGKMQVVQVEELKLDIKHHGVYAVENANQRGYMEKKRLKRVKNIVKSNKLIA